MEKEEREREGEREGEGEQERERTDFESCSESKQLSIFRAEDGISASLSIEGPVVLLVQGIGEAEVEGLEEDRVGDQAVLVDGWDSREQRRPGEHLLRRRTKEGMLEEQEDIGEPSRKETTWRRRYSGKEKRWRMREHSCRSGR